MSSNKENRYYKNSFYLVSQKKCGVEADFTEIFKAKNKSELLNIKNRKFIGSGNYSREYKLIRT